MARRCIIAASRCRRAHVDADDAGKPGPQRLGADRRVVRKRHGDAGSGRHRRARSARLRRRDPRQRQRPGDRRRQAAGRSSSRCCRPAACRSPRRRSRSRSATAGSASARPRSMRKAPVPSCPAATIFPPTRPTSAPALPRPRSGSATSRPEIQLFAAGPPDALNRTVDVAALSSWLAVRAIDRETRRLDAIERGEPPPPMPASIPPATAALPPPQRRMRLRPISRLSDVPRARPRSAPASAEAESRRLPRPPARHRLANPACREPAGRAAAAADRGAAGAGAPRRRSRSRGRLGDSAAAELIALRREFRRRYAALKLKQVQRGRLLSRKDRTTSVRVAAMMGLVIEQMQQDIRKRLLVGFA